MPTVNNNVSLGPLNVVDKRKSRTGSTSPISTTTYAAAQDQSTVDAALAAANATYWTTARLNATCLTDKLFALRKATADAAGIS